MRTLPQDLKDRLIHRFAPILLLARDEPDYPVSPGDYVEHCALWSSGPPLHPKDSWGLPDAAGRRPLVERGGLRLQLSGQTPDSEPPAVPYGGASFSRSKRSEELWLDFAGWGDGTVVTSASRNTRISQRPRPALTQPIYTPEVWSVDEWLEQLGPGTRASLFGIGPEQRASQVAGAIVVGYHLLFPWHRQPRPHTLLNPADDPYTGDYEGDWTSYAVILRLDPDRDGTDARDATPIFGAFGQRWRGSSPDFVDLAASRVELRPWATLVTSGDHAAVVAARGTHNLYPYESSPGAGDTVSTQWIEFGQSTGEPANEFVSDSVEKPFFAYLAAKVLAGTALGGVVGFIVGAIAAAAEAEWAEEEGVIEEPKLEQPPGGVSENDSDAPNDAETQSFRIAIPPGGSTPPDVSSQGSELRDWLPPSTAIITPAPTFVVQGTGRLRLPVRWGVRCVDDGLLRRSGIFFPDYRAQIVDELLKAATT